MPPPERRPYTLPDPHVEHMRAQIRAQEDEEIFRRLDQLAAQDASPIIPAPSGTIHLTTPALPPGYVYAVTEPERVRGVSQDQLLGLSWVPHPVQPQARMILTQDEWDDIVGWAVNEDQGPTQEDVFRREYLGQFPAPEEPSRPPGWTLREMPGQTIVNERAIQGRRVQFPEFEIISNPEVRLDDVRRRRFNLMERRRPLSAAVSRILGALMRAKIPQNPAPPAREPREPMTYWEALVELDLVDDVS